MKNKLNGKQEKTKSQKTKLKKKLKSKEIPQVKM